MNQNEFWAGRRARAALYTALLSMGWGAAAFGQTQALEPDWSFESDGSWLPQVVSVGNEGTQVFTEIGSFSTQRLLFSGSDQQPPTPVWQDAGTVLHFNQVVDSSERSDVHVVLHQEQVPGSAFRRAVVEKYTSASGTPDWEYVFPVDIYNHPHTSVRVSGDGTRIAAVVHDTLQSKAIVTVLGANGPEPERTFLVDTFGPFKALELSDDGSTLAMHSGTRLSICDLDVGQVLFQQFYFGAMFFGALDVSTNGDRVATSGGSQVLVYERNSSSYSQVRVIELGATGFNFDLELSADGSRIAYGKNDSQQPSVAKVFLEDVATGQLLVSYTQNGVGGLSNTVGEIELSSDGERLVAGLYGDGNGTQPEVLVFEAGTNAPVSWFDAPGTVLALELSHDGGQLAVGAREGHNSVFGGGGGYYFIDTCSADLSLTGVPSVGSTVRFGQQAAAGTPTRLLYASGLAAEPRVFANAGTLYLSEGSLSALPGAAIADGNGVAKTDYSIPNSSALVGTSLYFQGLALRPRQLTEDYVKMTILP